MQISGFQHPIFSEDTRTANLLQLYNDHDHNICNTIYNVTIPTMLPLDA